VQAHDDRRRSTTEMLEGENRSNASLQNSQNNTPNLKQITLRTSTITPQLIFNIQCRITTKSTMYVIPNRTVCKKSDPVPLCLPQISNCLNTSFRMQEVSKSMLSTKLANPCFLPISLESCNFLHILSVHLNTKTKLYQSV
jgi:hypothetical protein